MIVTVGRSSASDERHDGVRTYLDLGREPHVVLRGSAPATPSQPTPAHGLGWR
ncbi:hypothetical protein [Micromonospora deserti]|uniref:hypothetical protein n=1 Tax=Micromonospora deserti TaxID=2070366 RepID=UPI0018F5B1A7|nr:hypothetical protein [Micromonospora deserti]